MTSRGHGSSDPLLVSLGVLAVLAIVGFAAVGLAWRGAAGSTLVANQLPFVVSGGFGGLAFLVVGVGLLTAQNRRRTEARRRAEFEHVVDAAYAMLELVRSS